MNVQNLVSKGESSCHKHYKTSTGKVSSHAPTIKCHEEVMSKISSCTNEDCVSDLKTCGKTSCHRKQKGRPNIRTVTSKCNIGRDPHQTESTSGTRFTAPKHRDLHQKTVKSRSAPVVQISENHEDSVDFIPVKLTPNIDRKQRPQKKIRQNFESRLTPREKSSKLHRPTWDEILRNNLEVISKQDKSPSKKYLSADKSNKYNNVHSSSRPITPKKKESERKTEKFQGQGEVRKASHNQASEMSKSTESEKLPIFQHINSSDPIKTLDFLIRQLRDGLLRQPQNDSLQNMIVDMENALLKISIENKSHLNHPMDTDKGEQEDPATSVPLTATSNYSYEEPRHKQMDIVQLEQNLEKSCRYLQSLCIKQKESCNNYLREKEQLSLQLAESRRLLTVSKSKEKNYEITIGELRLKLQEANTKIDQLKQSLEEIENKNATLKEENQAMISLKESLKRVGVRMKQITSEKEKLQSKLSLKDLEIEKLKVLLQVKTAQGNDPKEDNNLLLAENDLDVRVSDDEKDLSIISLSTTTSWSERPGLICSSQASSSPRHSPSPYNSWQHISSIVQQPSAADDINRGIAVILQGLKKKSEQMEPLRLELRNPSSCSSLLSDRDVINSKVVYSDGDSEGFSS